MSIADGIILGLYFGIVLLTIAAFIASKWNNVAHKKWQKENGLCNYTAFGPIEIKIKTGGPMNNRKQQALDALDVIINDTRCSLCKIGELCHEYRQEDMSCEKVCADIIKQFVESVDSVDMSAIKKQILDLINGPDSPFRIAAIRCLIEQLPDTLNTSRRCEELEKQVKHFEWLIKSSTESFGNALDERDKHISELQSQLESETLTSENRLHSAETFRNELEYSRRYGRELQSQLEAERAAHSETRAKLEELENDYNELSERYNQTAKQLEAASAYIPKTNPCMMDDFGNMTSVDSDDLPTKAERLAEMQRVADYVNNGATSEHYYVLDVVHSEDDDTIEFKTAALGCEHVSIGKPYGYKPEPACNFDGVVDMRDSGHDTLDGAVENGHKQDVLKDELPTKAERLEEMQRVADYVNGKDPHVDDFVTVEKDGIHNGYWFMVGGDMIGSLHSYKPEPVAPADGEPVFVRDMELDGQWKPYTRRMVSSGKLTERGGVFVYNKNVIDDFYEWCSISDRSNHSPGWKREWEPDFVKK